MTNIYLYYLDIKLSNNLMGNPTLQNINHYCIPHRGFCINSDIIADIAKFYKQLIFMTTNTKK